MMKWLTFWTAAVALVMTAFQAQQINDLQKITAAQHKLIAADDDLIKAEHGVVMAVVEIVTGEKDGVLDGAQCKQLADGMVCDFAPITTQNESIPTPNVIEPYEGDGKCVIIDSHDAVTPVLCPQQDTKP